MFSTDATFTGAFANVLLRTISPDIADVRFLFVGHHQRQEVKLVQQTWGLMTKVKVNFCSPWQDPVMSDRGSHKLESSDLQCENLNMIVG